MLLTLFLTLLFCGCSIGYSISKRETNINELMDVNVDVFNWQVDHSGENYTFVDDFSVTFEKQVAFFRAKGSFTASDGIVGDFTTWQRTGDATLTSTPTTVTVTLHMGLRNLEVYYRNYEASFLNIKVSGDIRLTVETNSVFAQFTFVYEDEDSCSTNLDRSYVEALDGIRVDISGLGLLDWASGRIVEFLIGRFNNEAIVDRVEAALRLMGEQQRNDSTLCELVRNLVLGV